MKDTGFQAEVLLDLAFEVLELTTRKVSLTPARLTAIELADARWQKISPEERSAELRRVVQARRAKHRSRKAEKNEE
jgi:hypothetical protein